MKQPIDNETVHPETLYRSPYEAYPFLSEPTGDHRCDFELLTDEMASQTGLLRSLLTPNQQNLRSELLWVDEMIYHLNPALRTGVQPRTEDTKQLYTLTKQRQTENNVSRFVLPVGTTAACVAHILRVQAKKAVRILYAQVEAGQTGLEPSIDFANLLSAYFFALALSLNTAAETQEVTFDSRVYNALIGEQNQK